MQALHLGSADMAHFHIYSHSGRHKNLTDPTVLKKAYDWITWKGRRTE